MKYCLDTNAAIYFLAGRLAEPLPDGEWMISVITELELLSYPFATSDDEQKVREFVQHIGVVELTSEVKEIAITLRREKRLKLPDAVIAATALAAGATLITNDTGLAQVPGVDSIRPAVKA